MGISVASSVTWPRWGMMRNGVCSERATRARHIGAIVSSSSLSTPTPTVGDSRNSRNCTANQGKGSTGNTGMTLCDYVVMYPTPTATSYGRNKSTSAGSKERLSLQSMAARGAWPTPTAQDAKNSTLPPSQITRDSIPGALLRSGERGMLSPMWVEWLMGLPIGWTDLELLAMDKSHNK